MAVRDFKQFESTPLHDSTEHTKEISYQEYLPQAESASQLRELFFFINIALFCILTVFFSFIFLSAKISTFLSFTLAVVLSLMVIQGYRTVRRKKSR